jgi:twinkle protein
MLQKVLKVIKSHIPCPCGESSDAYTQYTNGGHCFSCNKNFKEDCLIEQGIDTIQTTVKEEPYTLQYVSYRGHSVDTLKKYGVKVKVLDSTGEPVEVHYPYHAGQQIKHRNLQIKGFSVANYKGPGLFGWEAFSAGSSLACTITEGEEDAMSAYEMLGSKYPVYSVQSSSQAKKDCEVKFKELSMFEKIYLDFDNDEKGQVAARQVASLFPYSKVFYVHKTKYKDANEYQLAGAQKEYLSIWHNAKRYDPENIVSSFGDIEKFFKKAQKKAIATFPFKGLQSATYGIRTGETYLFKALEGIGKTEVLGAIESHIVKTTDIPIGIIHLEEDIFRTCSRFVNYEIHQPVHLEELTDLTKDQIFNLYKQVVKDDTRINYFLKTKNDESPEDFLNAIRFMVASAGCKVVAFDHITRLATSFKSDDERLMLDHVSTKLSEMAEELDFALLMISHVNDEGQTRGSRNISKEAHTVINMYRDRESPDPVTRNTTTLSIEKNRPTSITGPIDPIYFDPLTFTLSDHPSGVSLPPVES